MVPAPEVVCLAPAPEVALVVPAPEAPCSRARGTEDGESGFVDEAGVDPVASRGWEGRDDEEGVDDTTRGRILAIVGDS